MRDTAIREFTRQAPTFDRPDTPFADAGLLEWIAAHVDVGPDDRVLDVAGGAGHVGRHLGRRARLTVVADLTPAMLERGVAAARAEDRHDVIFVRADAAALPLPDGQFEVVVSRFALHHLDDVDTALREMRRACAPGGTVTIVDMVAEPGPAGERLDELERLRDPSHVVCPREEPLRRRLAAAGLEPVTLSARDDQLLAEPWLDRARPSPAARTEVLDALRAEAAGGSPTGLRAATVDGALTITHRYLLLHARRT